MPPKAAITSTTPAAIPAATLSASQAQHVHAGPSFRPLYDQIKVLLTQSLVAGEWKPGEAIPSEFELAARYQVSQGTVRKAIDALAAEHILIRRQGKGTFVATHTEPNHQYRFLRIIPDSGAKLYPTSVFLDLKRGKASAEAARLLDLRAGSAVHTIQRLLVFASTPLILDEIVLSSTLFPGLTLEKMEESHGSIYSFYETAYGMGMIRAEERIRAVAADAFTAKHLRIARGTPLLCVDRIAFTYGDKPVEWRRGLCLTENYSYYNELS
jgi:GntR family transcriptional regulator